MPVFDLVDSDVACTVGNVTLQSKHNSSLPEPGVEKDKAHRITGILTTPQTGTFQVAGTTVTLSTRNNAIANCQFSDSKAGSYTSTLTLAYGDRVMENDAWILCTDLASSTEGPYLIANETDASSINKFETFVLESPLIVYGTFPCARIASGNMRLTGVLGCSSLCR